MHITLVLRDGLLEHLTIPASPNAAADGAAGAAGAAGKSNAAGRIGWSRLLHELVTATHAFSVEDDSPLLVDTPKGLGSAPASPAGPKRAAPPAGAPPKALALADKSRDAKGKGDGKADAAAAPRSVSECFHITYNDDEGDLVTVSNEAGLTEAYRLAEVNGKAVELSVTVLDMPPALKDVSIASYPDFATVRSAAGAAAPTTKTAVTPVASAAPGSGPAGAGAPAPQADSKANAAAAAANANPVVGGPLDPKPVAPEASGRASAAAVPPEVAPGALSESKLNPILGRITASVGDGGEAAAAADASAVGSPFEAVCVKHLRRTLALFESYHLNLSKDKYVALTRLKQTFARVSEKTPNYQLLKAKHEKAVAALNARFASAVELLVAEYDKFMSAQSPASFLLPMFVSVSVEHRAMRFEVPLRAVDTVADLRDILIELSAKRTANTAAAPPADPIVEFGPLSHFALRRPADAKSPSGVGAGAAAGSPSAAGVVSPSAPASAKSGDSAGMNFLDFLFGVGPRKPTGPKHTSTVIENENVTMHALGVTSGCEFVLVGGVRRRSEQPKCICGLRVPTEAALQYYRCVECGENALCRGCAMSCHFGHTIALGAPADHPKPGQMPCLCGVTNAGAAGALAGAVAPAPVSSCRIREAAAAAAPYAQLYTEEVGLLRAMGFADKALEHLTMTVPASAIAPVPPQMSQSSPLADAKVDLKRDRSLSGAAASSPPKPVSPLASSPPKDASVLVALAAPPPPPPAAPSAAAAAGGGAGASSAPVSAQVMVTVPVTLRALLQAKGGNVQSVVDTLLAWEKQGKLTPPVPPPPTSSPPSAARNAGAAKK